MAISCRSRVSGDDDDDDNDDYDDDDDDNDVDDDDVDDDGNKINHSRTFDVATTWEQDRFSICPILLSHSFSFTFFL